MMKRRGKEYNVYEYRANSSASRSDGWIKILQKHRRNERKTKKKRSKNTKSTDTKAHAEKEMHPILIYIYVQYQCN